MPATSKRPVAAAVGGGAAPSSRGSWRPRPRGHVASILDLGMKLHVPYNNDFKLIAALGPYAKYIASIYLPCDSRVLGTGRYDRTLALRNWSTYDRELGGILERVRPLGIDINR